MSQIHEDAKVEVDKKAIKIATPIKDLGIYDLKVELHSEVTADIKVNVARTETEAKEAEENYGKEPVEQTQDDGKTHIEVVVEEFDAAADMPS